MKGRKCGKGTLVCLITCILVIILIAVLITVLAFTVFKPKNLTTNVDSIELGKLDMNVNIFALKFALNVSLNMEVSVNNPNNFGLKFSDTTAILKYRGDLVGEAPIPSAVISPREAKELNLTVNIMADRILKNSMFLKDMGSDMLPLNFFLNISGNVNLLGFIKVHVFSTAACDFNLNLSARTVGEPNCVYTTKV